VDDVLQNLGAKRTTGKSGEDIAATGQRDGPRDGPTRRANATGQTGQRLTLLLHPTQVWPTPALSTEPADHLQELQRRNR
jgi:hypothetical protein